MNLFQTMPQLKQNIWLMDIGNKLGNETKQKGNSSTVMTGSLFPSSRAVWLVVVSHVNIASTMTQLVSAREGT